MAALRPRLEAAGTAAKAALTDFEAYLRDDVLPRSEGEGRLGADLFARKMRHTMRSETLTAEGILAAAEREFDAVRAEMIRLARVSWPRWRRGAPLPDDDVEIVRGVLDAIAAEHPQAGELLDFCRAETARIEAFCRDRDLIGLADEPLDIRWTPTFLRAFGGAMLIPPGPLDKGQKAFFAITPMPDDWPPERKESYLREDNARMLRLLTIHEAVPGHYLQGVYANRSESLPRAIFWSGVFAEGWAVYVTQVMMDVGYGADDAALLLTHWKFYLRAATNAIIDARIHTAGMTEEEAVALMVDGGFQEEAEARAKYNRARLSSTQLSTYFAGSMEMWDIELEARRRAAAAQGKDPDAIQPRGLPGGFGETPGFVYRQHLEAVIGHGSPRPGCCGGSCSVATASRTALSPRLGASAASVAFGAGSAEQFAKSIDPVAGGLGRDHEPVRERRVGRRVGLDRVEAELPRRASTPGGRDPAIQRRPTVWTPRASRTASCPSQRSSRRASRCGPRPRRPRWPGEGEQDAGGVRGRPRGLVIQPGRSQAIRDDRGQP